MDRLLARLERRFGGLAIEHLTLFLVGGMALTFFLAQSKPEFAGALALDLHRVRQGQVWRLFTYVFVPSSSSFLTVFFEVWFLWAIGSSLETAWGAFKYNAFFFVGMLGTTAAAWLSGSAVGSVYLTFSLLFAFATLFPDYEFLLFLVVPVKVKWLGLLSAGYLVFEAVQSTWTVRAAIVAAMANYFLFFAQDLVGFLRKTRRAPSSRVPAKAQRDPISTAKSQSGRTCAICGAAEADGADIRVCSCEKCGGIQRTLCLEHARNH